MSKRSFFYLLIVVFYSCNSHSPKVEINQDCTSYKITTEPQNDSLNFSDVIELDKIVRLESSNDALFGDISKMEILNDTIIIFDSKNNKVLTFDQNGKFLKIIGVIGKGPNEVGSIRNITIDKNQSEILILDDTKQKIFHFNLKGEMLSNEEAKVYPVDFAFQNNNILYYQCLSPIFFDQQINYDLLITKDGKVSQKYFPFPKLASFRFPINRTFYECNDTICFIDKWNSKVYSILDGEIRQRFCIDFMGNDVPLEYTYDADKFDKIRKNYSYLFDYVLENEQHVYFSYIKKNKLKKIIYNKLEGTRYTFTNETGEQELGEAIFHPFYTYNGYFISSVSPEVLINTNMYGKIHNSGLKKIAPLMNISDNLVLVFHRINNSY